MRVVIGDRNLLPHRELLEGLVPAHTDLIWHEVFDEAAIIADLATADVYVGGKFTAAMAAASPRLQLVHVAGAGTDNIAFASLDPRTKVANTFHHEDSIAEYVLSTAIMLRRGFVAQDRALRRGTWSTSVYDDALPQPLSMNGAHIGFVGFGHIGSKSWKLLRGLGCTGSAVTGSGAVDAAAVGLSWAADAAGLHRLMTESDIVVVSAPLNDHTRGMIGTTEFAALGSDGVLINVGRGPLVQQQALYDALQRNIIRAAAIDVWYSYPGPDGDGDPGDLPFADLPNLLMTPHSSGITRDTFVGRVRDIADNIRRLDRGLSLARTVR
ncbi:hydroxyacid dehydrogenase [Williamsia sp. 1138]|uniref:2-hydroxyacid dehydrogenase n=1 Tax=Williamsia sp. 1138 TaxID=1903117 RepID=UPI000A0FAF53|nr:2-hydroxyacid dehydrogenase [Williamsia sp. 1138]OZG29302.1 hydroxyacid dehydrogenase [Williamsia sp. 1138]